LLTAMIVALVMAITLTGYVNLSRTSLRLAHRTFFADSAVNLAETGLEEAVWMFNTMGSSSNATANKTLWTNNGWNCNSTIADVYMQSMGTGYV
jgi:Tfp pilus assembly protein PilX